MFTNSNAMAEAGSPDALQTLLFQIQQGGSDGLAAARELEGAYLLGCGVVSQESSGSDVNFLGGDDLFELSDLESGKAPSAAVLQCYYVSSEEPTFEAIDAALSDYVPGAGCYMYSYESSSSSSAGSQGIACYYRGDEWAGNAEVYSDSGIRFEAEGAQYTLYTLALTVANSTDKSGQFEHYSFTYDNDTEGQSGPVLEDDYYYWPISSAAQTAAVATTPTSNGGSGSDTDNSGGKSTSVNVDWRTLSKVDEFTYNGGFKIEIDIKMSPFIRKDDTATLQAVWSQVSGGQAFPKDSQFHNVSVSHWDEAKNIYYAVGEVSAKNVTEGFDLPTDGSIWLRQTAPRCRKTSTPEARTRHVS